MEDTRTLRDARSLPALINSLESYVRLSRATFAKAFGVDHIQDWFHELFECMNFCAFLFDPTERYGTKELTI